MTRSYATAALAALLLAALPAAAQYDTGGWTDYRPSKTLFNMGWQMSQPIGNFHNNYITGTSFRGFTFDWRSILQKSFSAGVRFNWNRYSNSLSNLVTTTPQGGALTGPAYRYADQFAVSAIAHYYFDKGDPDTLLKPYLGLGLGGVWSSSYQAMADLALSQSGFFFIATPEVGLMVNLSKGATTASLNLGFGYNFTTINFQNVSNAQSIFETVALTFAY
jgi:outer membrane protein W